MRVLSSLLVAVIVAGAGCRFDLGGIQGGEDGGTARDGAVVGDAEKGDAAGDGAADAPGDGPRPDGPQTDAAPQTDAQSDAYVDPCETMNCNDSNPCTNDGCSGGVCQHNVISGVPCGSGNNVCVAGSCVPCGGQSGQVCCAGSTCTGARLSCDGNSHTCQPCGGASQSCCGATPACDSGLVCAGGKCEPCGGLFERCCDSDACDSADVACAGGYCLTCGGHYQVCCAGRTCDTPYDCSVLNVCG